MDLPKRQTVNLLEQLPLNESEEKKLFFEKRKTPFFCMKDPVISKNSNNTKPIHFELFHEAKFILDEVKDKFDLVDYYIIESLGDKLSVDRLKSSVTQYLKKRKLTDIITVSYQKNLPCSAKLNSIGLQRRMNRPESRRYNLVINLRHDNIFLRETGIECLLDHEIDTHFIRAYNEGFQPWYFCRHKFGLSKCQSYEHRQIEEGLATINTLLAAKEKYLCISALLYYAICMAHFLTFEQLFDHLAIYIKDPDYRWKQCVRIKKNLINVDEPGGSARDQCYFEGAYYILAYARWIDFDLLYCGKLTQCDVNRVSRVARKKLCRMPHFMSGEHESKNGIKNVYLEQLLKIAKVNGIYVLPVTSCNKAKNFKSNTIINSGTKSTDCIRPTKISHYLMSVKKGGKDLLTLDLKRNKKHKRSRGTKKSKVKNQTTVSSITETDRTETDVFLPNITHF